MIVHLINVVFSSSGSIVSSDPEGYGSIISPYVEPVRTINEYLSINFQMECCIDADLCDLFYEQRPSLKCDLYVPPSFCKFLMLWPMVSKVSTINTYNAPLERMICVCRINSYYAGGFSPCKPTLIHN